MTRVYRSSGGAYGCQLLLALLLAVTPTAVLATVHEESCVAERAFYPASTGEQQLEDIRDARFTEFNGVLSLGYRHEPVWLRLRIDPQCAGAQEDLVVRIRPAYLDDIRVFGSATTDTALAVTGDRHPVERDAYPSLYFNVALPRDEVIEDVWLRVTTTSTTLIDVDVLALQEAVARDRAHELFAMLNIGALVVFLGWGLATWFESRERLLAVFVLKQFVGLFYTLAYLGYFRLIWPEAAWQWLSMDRLTSILIIVMVASAYLFDYTFLKEFRARRGLLACMKLSMAMSPVLLVLLIAVDPLAALKWNNLLVVISPFLSFTTALLLPAQPASVDAIQAPLPRRYAIVLYSLVLASVSVSSLPATGLVQGAEWSFSGYLMYSLWTGAAVLVMLQIRATRMRRQRVALAAALDAAERRAEAEHAMRVEQSRFLAMLTHELKTPLAVLQMATGAKMQTERMQASVDQAIRDMGAVIERCLQADRYESGQIVSQVSTCHLDEELRELVSNCRQPDRVQSDIAEMPALSTDRTLLRMAVTNLIDNALKYGDEQAPVHVHAYPLDRDGVAGVAIDVANLPGRAGWPDPKQVFRKYYRHPRAHKATGSGLGLFLVEGLARLLQGHVAYVPTEQEIVFRLWLPRH